MKSCEIKPTRWPLRDGGPPLMFILIAGGGRSARPSRTLRREPRVTIIEQRGELRSSGVQARAIVGDATEIRARAGGHCAASRLLIGCDGDDEDNMVICQMARSLQRRR
jgi:Trk K+ transport system NAD-binding subunit